LRRRVLEDSVAEVRDVAGCAAVLAEHRARARLDERGGAEEYRGVEIALERDGVSGEAASFAQAHAVVGAKDLDAKLRHPRKAQRRARREVDAGRAGADRGEDPLRIRG